VSNKNIIHEKAYWDSFYKNWGIEVPSQFCVQMITEVDRETSIVEFGSGNGRDSQFAASQGYIVTAMDLSDSAIESCNERMAARNIKHAFFMKGDVSIDDDICSALEHARSQDKAPGASLVAYSRFLLHSLDQQQEDDFIAALDKNLKSGDRLYLEYRSTKDAEMPKVFGNHYRRYVDSENLLDSMSQELNFVIDYTITGQGMAKYKNEDPFVTRIIATKK
jgi:tellurite methyltransferase